jgi:hypothetical protein
MGEMNVWEAIQLGRWKIEGMTIRWNNGFQHWSARSREMVEQQSQENDMVQMKRLQIEIADFWVGIELVQRDKLTKSQQWFWSNKVIQSAFEGTESLRPKIVVPSNSDFQVLKIERVSFFSPHLRISALFYSNRDLPSIFRFYKYIFYSILSLSWKLADSPPDIVRNK